MNKISGACWVVAVGLASSAALAGDIKWTGGYRAEGVFLKNFTLDKGAGLEDSYIIHHLILEPEIIPSDGLKIHSRFDIFNNALATSTAGQVFGTYSGPTTNTGGGATPPAVLSNTQQPQTINVNALYLEWINEFSALTVGRVPFHFGIGMTYSDGEGPFDHTLSNKDLVAYKIVMGNLTIMPGYGKVREGYLLNEDDINDYLAVAEYKNSESELSMGFMFDQRVAPQDSRSPAQGNDFPLTYFSNPAWSSNFGAAVADPGGAGFSAYNMNFYVKKSSDSFDFGAELGFISGYTGVQVLNKTSGANERIQLSGFGAAAELGYKTGDLNLKLLAGMASGDDPDTSSFEAYAFNPNYDIAMIMFQFPVGAPGYDALKSALFGSRNTTTSTDSSAQAVQGLDTEVITNAIYFAPKITWAMGERYDMIGTFAYATQVKPTFSSNVGGGAASQIGFETDLGFRYHPSKSFQWLTTLGGFFPGSAYSGVPGYPTSAAYGVISKAAINF